MRRTKAITVPGKHRDRFHQTLKNKGIENMITQIETKLQTRTEEFYPDHEIDADSDWGSTLY